MTSEQSIRVALGLRRWAVVGCSPDPGRDSHRIASLLISRGYDVTPINPACEEVLGRRAYPTVTEAAEFGPIDVVDIFRRPEAAGAHVDEAIAVGAGAVWMQLGVIDHDAAERATQAGLIVVMDRCPAIELPRLRIDGPSAS